MSYPDTLVGAEYEETSEATVRKRRLVLARVVERMEPGRLTFAELPNDKGTPKIGHRRDWVRCNGEGMKASGIDEEGKRVG